jgi:hypothetical protein
MMCRNVCLAGLFVLLIVLPSGCKKSPTTPTVPTGISAAFSPTSASADAVVSFTITVKSNSREVRAFGAQLTYDTSVLQFQDIAGGSLTGNWGSVDAGETSPGTVILGAIVGSGTAVPASSNGTLLVVHFKVTGAGSANGQQVSACLGDFADDLSQFSSGSACATFTLKK